MISMMLSGTAGTSPRESRNRRPAPGGKAREPSSGSVTADPDTFKCASPAVRHSRYRHFGHAARAARRPGSRQQREDLLRDVAQPGHHEVGVGVVAQAALGVIRVLLVELVRPHHAVDLIALALGI